MFKHILVPTDGTKLSARAVRSAVALAKTCGAKITGIYVIPPYVPPVYSEGMLYMADIGPQRHKELMAAAALPARRWRRSPSSPGKAS
jgi:nucleotide-binding universal stress UspA family protein